MSRAAIESLLQVGQRLHQGGKLAEAEAAYRKVLERSPQDPSALHFLGLIAFQTGRRDAAVDLLRRSVVAKRTPPEFHFNLAGVLLATGDADGAVQQYARAIELRSGYAEAHNHLCVALCRLDRLDEATSAGESAVGYAPASADARRNLARACFMLGSARDRQGRSRDAVAAYRRYTALEPGDPGGFVNLAVNLVQAGQFTEAVAACDRALALDPTNVQAFVNRGAALAAGGRTEEGVETFRRVAAVETSDPAAQRIIGMALSNLLLALHYDERDPEGVFAEHVWVGERFRSSRRTFPRPDVGTPERRIRVGYVSPDFRLHAVAHFIEPILAAHDREQFEVFCFNNSPAVDDVTRRLRGYDVHWRDIPHLSDHDAADAVAREGIDVLVDLAGHTTAFRVPMFAMKPAPVQVNYLGYPDTSGLRAMDYRITDTTADPPGRTEQYHVEQLVRLSTAWCYRPLDTAPPVGPLPCSTTGHVTFGSFNNAQKLTRPMLQLWARIVSSVPGARLVVKAKGLDDASHHGRVSDALLSGGLPAERFELLGRVPSMEAHLELYNRVDLALDTYPYNGTTTTCEALWMGVPVVTRAGKTHASRVGASLLTTVGLSELVADADEQYAAIATSLARDEARLAALRAGMRQRMSGSRLMDADTFTRELEAAYTTMVERARASEQAGAETP